LIGREVVKEIRQENETEKENTAILQFSFEIIRNLQEKEMLAVEAEEDSPKKNVKVKKVIKKVLKKEESSDKQIIQFRDNSISSFQLDLGSNYQPKFSYVKISSFDFGFSNSKINETGDSAKKTNKIVKVMKRIKKTKIDGEGSISPVPGHKKSMSEAFDLTFYQKQKENSLVIVNEVMQNVKDKLKYQEKKEATFSFELLANEKIKEEKIIEEASTPTENTNQTTKTKKVVKVIKKINKIKSDNSVSTLIKEEDMKKNTYSFKTKSQIQTN